jgi:biopolymer transport protein ExbD
MAGGAGFSSDDDVIAGINVTPLVDVVLVLLVIFLLTAPVIYQSSIQVQLPKAKTGGEAADKSPLSFTITKDGAVSWDNKPVNWDELGPRLAEVAKRNPDQTAVISADTATPHGQVVKLMDALRNAGLVRFALNVDSSGS